MILGLGQPLVAKCSDEWRAENSLPTVMLEERILGDASLRRYVDAANQEGFSSSVSDSPLFLVAAGSRRTP